MPTLDRHHSIADFRRSARRAMPRMVFDFVDGAAGSEATATDNAAALRQLRLVPRSLVDVSRRSLATTLFGEPSTLPIVIGPTGLASAVWPRGERALARAAAAQGIPFVLANGSGSSLESVAAEPPGRRWFQFYLPPERERAAAWIAAAQRHGFEALQLTVDAAVPGRRLRDLRNGFTLPFRWTARGLLDAALHPGWSLRMARHGIPRPRLAVDGHPPAAGGSAGRSGSVGAAGAAASAGPVDSAGAAMRARLSAALSLDDVAWVRDQWPGILIVKGLSDARQAAPLAALGVDGIVVSNHGGRQLDGAIAPIDVLPEFVAAIGKRMPILIDGGFRTGTDIAKALALGASAVQLGRATLYALAVAGEAGVSRALSLLAEELDTAMALCGACSPGELTADQVR